VTAAKLTPVQRGKLGGLTRAHKAGPNGMALAGAKGARATLERYGRAHFLALAFRRWHPESAIALQESETAGRQPAATRRGGDEHDVGPSG